MIQATLGAAIVASVFAAGVAWRYRDTGCHPGSALFRRIAVLVWLTLAALYTTAIIDPTIYIIKTGILTRLTEILVVAIYTGDIALNRWKND